MNWNLEGLYVKGLYMGEFPVQGLVTLSRVKYGGRVQHTVELDHLVTVGEFKHDRILLDHEHVDRVMSRC